MNILRHGDINIYAVGKVVAKKLKAKLRKSKDNVLALGETSGHKHTIVAERPQTATVHDILDVLGVKLIEVQDTAAVTHEEHNTLTLPKQTYISVPRREVDNKSHTVRTVKD